MRDRYRMRVADEPNVKALRQKAAVLEAELERVTKDYEASLRTILALRGMSVDAIALNLPGLIEQAKGRASKLRAGTSERRTREGGDAGDKSKRGHGPTQQLSLAVREETFDVDEADKFCTACGGGLSSWDGADDVVEVIDRIPAQWIVRKCTLKKFRCKCGGCVVTADSPEKVISGGRYTLDVALQSCIDKFVFHIPIERQARMAVDVGMKITSQTLWDQQRAVAKLLDNHVEKIRGFVLARDVLGADLTSFMHIKKGGGEYKQVWQLACPDARYFEMHDSKSAKTGERVFTTRDADGKIVTSFKGIAVVDGAAELEALGRELGFTIANCWSHARRNVLKAESEAPGQVEQFLDLVAVLYEIEREAAGDKVDKPGGYRRRTNLDELGRLRRERSKPATEAIQKWILEQSCIPGGKLKKALEYVAGRWTALTRFLEDPHIPLDNNITEAGFVGLAQGRRNYVGCRTERGMKVATTFYTVFESARVAGANPDAYLRYAARAILKDGDALLPHEWLTANP